MTLSQKLVILRKTKGITQDDFAKALEVSRQSVHKWESGQCYPEVPKIIKMKEILDISIDNLLDDNFEIPLPEKKKRHAAAIKNEKVQNVEKEEAKGQKKVVPVLNNTDKDAISEEESVIEEIKVEVREIQEEEDEHFSIFKSKED